MDGRPVLDVETVVRLEQAVAAAGTSLATLMERAGGAVADGVRAHAAPCKVLVLAGSGNNGGDGWVAARDLALAGYAVTLVSSKDPSALKAEPAYSTARAILELELVNLELLVNPRSEDFDQACAEAEVIIDALLGTGFNGEALKEPLRFWVDQVNRLHDRGGEAAPFVVAADVPSGLSAQTGTAASPTVHADLTVTMIVPKPGLVAAGAASFVGELQCADLGVDLSEFSQVIERDRNEGQGAGRRFLLPRNRGGLTSD